MTINKVGSKGIEDGSVATVDLAPGSVTNPKLANSSFTFDGTSVSLGASESVNVSASWQSVITADGSTGTTAVARNGYFIDTTSAAHTLTLPASATIGDFIAIKDYAGTFGTNNLTIARNGHNIQGAANDSLITTNRASLVLVYVDSTKGWLYWEEHNVADLEGPIYISATGGTITTSGNDKIHTFTGDGCFVVSQAPSNGAPGVNYLVVAGGGGGGVRRGSGGGAGGYRFNCSTTVTATTYPITVGGGGTGGPSACAGPGLDGTDGSNSVGVSITSTGGGGGARQWPVAGHPGGSGGGGDPVGAGNTPSTSPSQGNPGGLATPCATQRIGGGGGGATAAGGGGSASQGGAGGNGSSSWPGDCTVRAGGGGGGAFCSTPAGSAGPGPGGTGGGGAGGANPNGNACSGTANTGGGGGGGAGGCGGGSGGNGGKGIVIIKYTYQ
jgi:hypothetical protein